MYKISTSIPPYRQTHVGLSENHLQNAPETRTHPQQCPGNRTQDKNVHRA